MCNYDKLDTEGCPRQLGDELAETRSSRSADVLPRARPLCVFADQHVRQVGDLVFHPLVDVVQALPSLDGRADADNHDGAGHCLSGRSGDFLLPL